MQTVEFTIEPATPPAPAPRRKPARRRVTKKVTVPKPAPVALQVLGLLLLVALLVGTVVLAMEVDNAAVRLAAGSVFLVSAILLVSWIALVLRTGFGLKQILEILKQFFGAVREASSDTDEGKAGEEVPGTPAPAT